MGSLLHLDWEIQMSLRSLSEPGGRWCCSLDRGGPEWSGQMPSGQWACASLQYTLSLQGTKFTQRSSGNRCAVCMCMWGKYCVSRVKGNQKNPRNISSSPPEGAGMGSPGKFCLSSYGFPAALNLWAQLSVLSSSSWLWFSETTRWPQADGPSGLPAST